MIKRRVATSLAAAGLAATAIGYAPVVHAAGCANVAAIDSRWTLIKGVDLPLRPHAPDPVDGFIPVANVTGAVISRVAPSHLMMVDHFSVATSTDGGCTWRQGPTNTTPSANSPHAYYSTTILQAFWSPSRSEPNTAYVVLGSPNNPAFADDPTVTVLRTTDGGTSWSPMALGPGQVGYAPSLSVAPSDPKRLYLTVQEGVVLAAPRLLYVSKDGGTTWTYVSSLQGLSQRQNSWHIAVDPLVPTTVWSYELGSPDPGGTTTIYLRRSRDGGATWTNLKLPDDSNVNLGFFIVHLPKNKVRLVTLPGYNQNLHKQRRLYISDNEGDTWRDVIVPEGVNSLEVGRDHNRMLLSGGSTDSVGYYYVSRKHQWYGMSAPPKIGGAVPNVGLIDVVDSGSTMNVYFNYSKSTGPGTQEHGIAILKLRV